MVKIPTAMPRKTPRKTTVEFGARRDWVMRLQNSVVFVKGEPFYVLDVREESNKDIKDAMRLRDEAHSNWAKCDTKSPEFVKRKRAYLKQSKIVAEMLRKYNTSGNKTIIGRRLSGLFYKDLTVPATSLDLSFKPLGFMNYALKANRQSASYLSRSPGQQNRHGLCKTNILEQSFPSSGGLNYISSYGIDSTPFYNTLMGIYPNVEEALDNIFKLEGTNMQAFHRDFAVSVDEIGHVTLYYRTNVVGMSSNYGETFTLAGRYKYLTETLTELKVRLEDD